MTQLNLPPSELGDERRPSTSARYRCLSEGLRGDRAGLLGEETEWGGERWLCWSRSGRSGFPPLMQFLCPISTGLGLEASFQPEPNSVTGPDLWNWERQTSGKRSSCHHQTALLSQDSFPFVLNSCFSGVNLQLGAKKLKVKQYHSNNLQNQEIKNL